MFGIVLVAFLLFVTERYTVDVTALIILVLLTLLGQWTGVSAEDALSGFSNEATVTVLAMLILSESIRRTGAVQLLVKRVIPLVGDSERRQLIATVGIAGPASGFVNDTPVVALLLPFVSELGHRGNTSPSKLLIPLSYAAMLGGTLTLIGTSTNLLASGLAIQLLGRPLSIFEFTPLGAVVLFVGALYLIFIAPRLLPERVQPREMLVEEYDIDEYLAEVVVRDGASCIGTPINRLFDDTDFEVVVLEIVRNEQVHSELFGHYRVKAGDILVLSVGRDTFSGMLEQDDFELHPDVTHAESLEASHDRTLVEIVVPRGSTAVGRSIRGGAVLQRFEATPLALRRGESFAHQRMDQLKLKVGDTLLVWIPQDKLADIDRSRTFILAREVERTDYRHNKIPIAFAILAGVVGSAALGVLEIQIATLTGVVLMLITGVLEPGELYEGVDWNVIFLLAGIIPLGIAMADTGAATFLGAVVAQSGAYLPDIAVLGLIYTLTVVLTNVMSNNASVVLMLPVAVTTATQLGARPLSFVIVVMFAASAAFITPMGYQTNLFVYGPGGYRFSDYLRVGVGLQVILILVTILGTVFFFGI